MRLASHKTRRSNERTAYVLIAVLIVIVVLSLAAYRYSDMTMSEFRASDRILKNAQAKALADSGIHYTAAMLADANAFSGTLGSNPFNNQSAFGKVEVDLGNGRKGYFTIIAVDYTQDSSSGSLPTNYGVSDESAKINLNALLQLDPTGQVAINVLQKLEQQLPALTDDIINAIVDWIDTDDDQRTGGAESQYYLGLTEPYACKNGPLDSLEELLLVQGVTPSLLYGSDLNRNGKLDPDESAEGSFNPGLYPFLTVYSRERNVDSTGAARINVNGKDLKTLYGQLKDAVGQDMAAAVIAYRIYSAPAADDKASQTGKAAGLTPLIEQAMSATTAPKSQRNISSIYQLLGTSISIPAQQKGQKATTYPFPIKDSNSADDLGTLVDKTTTVKQQELPARVNIMTASPTVLAALPGLAQTDIDAINAARPALGSTDPTDPTYTTTAWLYTKAGITAAKMQTLERYITAQTQVYRIQSIGYFEKDGPLVRLEAIVDTNGGTPRIIYYRDLTELGRSIDPRN